MPHRYLAWLAATPCLISVLGKLVPPGPSAAASRRVTTRTLVLDVLMVLSGGLERCVPSSVRGAVFVLCLALFAATVHGQLALMQAAGPNTQSGNGPQLRSLRLKTLVTWFLYPAVRLLTEAGGMGLNAEEVLLTVLDVVSKFGYSSLLLVSSFDHLQSVKQQESNARAATPVRQAR